MSKCKYCGKESYDRPFCPECGKKYFGFQETIPEKIPQTDQQTTLTTNTQEKNYQKQFTEYSHRKCSYCNKQALLGSYFCQNHQQEFIENNQKHNYQQQNNQYINYINQINEDIKRNYRETSYIKTNTQNRICEICGACSYNMPYCNSCYKSFIKGENYNPLKQYEGEKIYLCKSGIKVRSLSEREISDFLTENKIPHEYEHELKYKFTNYVYGKTFIKSLHPDFYIPGPINFQGKIIQDVYIEFWGFEESNISYTNSKRYKLKNYKEMGITLINTDKEDLNNVNKSLTYKLLNYKENTINF